MLLLLAEAVRLKAKVSDLVYGNEYQGLWSRRLTRSDRLVYRVSEDRVYFLSARLHYPRL